MFTALTAAQRDALCELSNIGAGHGAESLSRLLAGERIGFRPPESREATGTELGALLGGAGVPRVAGSVAFQGEAEGALWLVLAPEDAEALALRLGALPADAESEQAVLAGTVGRMAASALAAMGRFSGLLFEPLAPRLRRASADALGAELCGRGTVEVLVTHLHAPGLAAQLLFLPEAASLPVLLRSLRV